MVSAAARLTRRAPSEMFSIGRGHAPHRDPAGEVSADNQFYFRGYTYQAGLIRKQQLSPFSINQFNSSFNLCTGRLFYHSFKNSQSEWIACYPTEMSIYFINSFTVFCQHS